MEDQVEEKPNNRVNAGRGVVETTNSNSNKNTTPNQEDDKDRPDDRARKAGY
ncbi:MAG: hypothetical protein GKR92_03105 [Gammaproteobacteria bacterium]|nr:MAG: hypothetical protein GKR92_03105 [Gammaproteobacteria bacterium]